MNFIQRKICNTFDPLYRMWEHEKIHRKISVVLVLCFLISLVLIEFNRHGFVPPSLSSWIPKNHFYAVQLSFTVVLILEVISLIFSLPNSFSKSVGKQFEILALILMRNAFKELSYFVEPITYTGNEEAVLRILSDGFGALLIFALLGVYYLVQSKPSEEKMDPEDLMRFIAAKKGVALVLLTIFLAMGLNEGWSKLTGHAHGDFLHDFYTLLILTDVLVILISQCYQPCFYAVFRNSGFSLSTLIIRLALAAPPFYNVLLGVSAALFAILLTLVSNRLFIGKTGSH